MLRCSFNGLGLYEYDIDGAKARELEGVIGIKVIMHSECFLLLFTLK